jgi:hypothetical protein
VDPVGSACEHEEDTDQDLDGSPAGVERRVDDAARLGEFLELVLEADQDLVLDPSRGAAA